MKPCFVLSLLLLMLTASFAAECIACDELSEMPRARLLISMDETAKTMQVYAFYENLSADPTRQPIENSIIIMELSNTSGLKELYKTYTNDRGEAPFDFSTWGDACVNFKILYCPFCTPESPECGFSECLNYSGIETTYTTAADIPDGPGAAAPATLSSKRYLPEVNQVSYCATPPLSLATAPALCLPLIIIFSLLGGALYVSGRNPFAAFNIGGARVGRHLRYQARGRGFSMDIKQVAQSVSAATQEASERAKAKAEGREYDGARYFLVSDIKALGDVVKGFKAEAVTPGQGAQGETAGPGRATVVGKEGTVIGAARQERAGMGERGRAEVREGARTGEARIFGGKTETGERAFSGTEIAKAWGTELGLGLARIGAALLDRTWIGGLVSVCGFSLSGWLENKISQSTREQEARVHGLDETLAAEFGSFLEDRVDCTAVQTDEEGNQFISVTLTDDSTVRLYGARVDAEGHWSGTLEIPSANGEHVTRYMLSDGAIVGAQVVTGKGTANEMTVSYAVSQGAAGPVLQATSVTTGGQTMEVRMDAAGQIVQIGSMSIVRREDGTVIGFRDPSGQSFQGTSLPEGNPMRAAVDSVLGSHGQALSGAPGFTYSGQLDMLLTSAKEGVNDSFTRTTQYYSEGLGLVKVTNSDLLTPGAGSYDVTIMDSNYRPGDQGWSSRAMGDLPSGTVIHVENGEFSRVTMPDGTSRAVETRDARGGTEAYIAGTEIRLGYVSNAEQMGGASARDAGAFSERMGALQEKVGQLAQAYESWRQTATADAAAALRESNPALFTAFEDAFAARERSAEALERNLAGRGIDEGVADAAHMLFEASTPSAAAVAGVESESGRPAVQQALEASWTDAAPVVMREHAADLLHTAEGTETAVAQTLLELGPGLASMSLSEAQAYVAARTQRLPQGERANVGAMVAEMFPQAQQVALDFAAAPVAMSYEVSANSTQYLSGPEQAYRSAFQAPPGMSAEDAAAAREAFVADASRAFAATPPDAAPEQRGQAVMQFLGDYAQRAAENPQDNPINLSPQEIFLGTMAAVAPENPLACMVDPVSFRVNPPSAYVPPRTTTGELADQYGMPVAAVDEYLRANLPPGQELPSNIERSALSYEPMTSSGFVTGVHAPLAAAPGIGAGAASAYSAATEGMQHYAAGEYHDAQVDFARSRAVVDAFDYALPGRQAERDRLLREGTQIQETEAFRERYAERREDFRTQFGVDIGEYGTPPEHRPQRRYQPGEVPAEGETPAAAKGFGVREPPSE